MIAAEQPVVVLIFGAITAFLLGVAGVITALVQLRKAKLDLVAQEQGHQLAMQKLKQEIEAGRVADRRANKDDTTAIIDRLRQELDRAWARIDTLETDLATCREKCDDCLSRLEQRS